MEVVHKIVFFSKKYILMTSVKKLCVKTIRIMEHLYLYDWEIFFNPDDRTGGE